MWLRGKYGEIRAIVRNLTPAILRSRRLAQEDVTLADTTEKRRRLLVIPGLTCLVLLIPAGPSPLRPAQPTGLLDDVESPFAVRDQKWVSRKDANDR